MEEKKNIFRRLWDFMNDPRLVKPLLIAIPCLTLILVGLILWPSVRELQASARAQPGPACISVAPAHTAAMTMMQYS